MKNSQPKNEQVSSYENLKHTPPEFRTSKELSEAVKRDIRCVGLVPEGMRVEGIPKLSKQEIEDVKFVADTVFMDKALADLPPERRTTSVSMAALLADSLNIWEVPEKILSDEFILKLLQMDGNLICAVDGERKTKEMYMTAFENTEMAITNFPPEMITQEIAMKAVEKNGRMIYFLPDMLKTPEICQIALNNLHPDGKEYEIISEVSSADVCLAHLKKIERENGDPFLIFGSINPKIITPEMAQLAVRLEPSCIQFVPDHLKTPEMCESAVEKDWMNMRFIPENKKTKTLCDIAMHRSIHAQQLVPERLKTPEMYMFPMKDNGLNLEYVPEKYRTPEVCLQAVMSNRDAMDFVPEGFKEPFNIYDFYHGKLTDNLLTVKQLNFDQVQKIFTGESVQVSGMKFIGATMRNFTIDYDRKTNQISMKATDETETPEKKQNIQIERKTEKRKRIKI